MSLHNDSYYCNVLAVGIDSHNNILYVRFSVYGDNSLGALQHPKYSRLILNGNNIANNVDVFTVRASAIEILGTLKFVLANRIDIFDSANLEALHFSYGQSGYSLVQLNIPKEFIIKVS